MNSRYRSCFVSYGQPDLRSAETINALLRDEGIKTWAWYEQRKMGVWRPRIQKAIDEHECILLIVSKKTLERPGVQDENRLALADDVRAYTGRLLPVLLDDIKEIETCAKNPEQRELLNLIRRVLCVKVQRNKNGRKNFKKAKEEIKDLIRKDVSKVLVIGSVSVGTRKENEKKGPMIRSVARATGKYLALHPEKPICMTTKGGGIDSYVCEGFTASAQREVTEGRLWLYPVAQARECYDGYKCYDGYGRDIEISLLPEFEGSKNMKIDDTMTVEGEF